MRYVSIFLLMGLLVSALPIQQKISGAWELREGNVTHTLVIVDDYFSLSSFDRAAKKFIQTQGGTCFRRDGMLTGKIEYHTADRSKVGSDYTWPLVVKKKSIALERDGSRSDWSFVDDGTGPLAGNWRITGREQGGKMSEIRPAARKTIKILSGKRFQWAAINSETGDFFGTGGGTYTFRDGVYTEYIEFFSRDSSRVGMSLSFDGKVEGRNWHHSGKSSKGEPIREIWSR